jgi:hypothetical protein
MQFSCAEPVNRSSNRKLVAKTVSQRVPGFLKLCENAPQITDADFDSEGVVDSSDA